MVDRSAFDRIMQAGGFISARTGSAPDANAIPIAKDQAELAMDFAECIGCGACVATCPNGAAMLFVSAKISHLGLLPQGQPERDSRALRDGGRDGAGGVRRLHQLPRVRGGVPEGDLDRRHRPDEPGLAPGAVPRRHAGQRQTPVIQVTRVAISSEIQIRAATRARVAARI